MKPLLNLALVMMIGASQLQAQTAATKYLYTKGWTGNLKITVSDVDPVSGLTIYLTAAGPATLMNTNPKTPVSMVWPQPRFGNQNMPNISGLDPASPTYMQDLQNAMAGASAIANEYLQWDAEVSYAYKSKKDEFPVDVRDYTCTYQSKKKSEAVVFIYADEMKECWFSIKGVVVLGADDMQSVFCQGSIDGVDIHSLEELPNPDLRYTAEGSAMRNLSAFPGPHFSGTSTYEEGTKTITIEFDFSPVK